MVDLSNIRKDNKTYLYALLNRGNSGSSEGTGNVEIVLETGNSTTAVMSLNAVTLTINNILNNLYTYNFVIGKRLFLDGIVVDNTVIITLPNIRIEDETLIIEE